MAPSSHRFRARTTSRRAPITIPHVASPPVPPTLTSFHREATAPVVVVQAQLAGAPQGRASAAPRPCTRDAGSRASRRATAALATRARASRRRPRLTTGTLSARADDADALAARLAQTKARVLTTQEAADMLQVSTKYLRESPCVRYVLSPTKTLWLDVDLYAFLLTLRFDPSEHTPAIAVAA